MLNTGYTFFISTQVEQGMQLSRKQNQTWHFTKPDHCGWAQTFTERDAFDETIQVSSIEEVSDFCTMCRERREE